MSANQTIDTTIVEEVVETPEDLNEEVEDQDSETDDTDETDEESTEDTDEEQEEDEEEQDEDNPSDETGSKKQTAEERKAQLQKEIQDLANQRRALKDELQKELLDKIQEEVSKKEAEVPNYVEIDWEKVNVHVAAELEAIDNLKFDGRAAEALLKQRQLQKLYDQIEENEKAKNTWKQQQAEKQAQQETTKQINSAIAQAADLVRSAMSVSEDDWKLGEQWFLEQRKVDALLDTQYREMVYNQGPTHALKWAYDYVTKNMGQQAKQEKVKREEGKKKVVGGNTTGVATNEKLPKTFDEMMKLPSAEIERLEKKNPKLFNKLLNAKYKS